MLWSPAAIGREAWLDLVPCGPVYPRPMLARPVVDGGGQRTAMTRLSSEIRSDPDLSLGGLAGFWTSFSFRGSRLGFRLHRNRVVVERAFDLLLVVIDAGLLEAGGKAHQCRNASR
jgi:hypothetical protein